MSWKAAYPNGRVNHLVQMHDFSPYYLRTRCGETVGNKYLIEGKRLPMCKKCKERNKNRSGRTTQENCNEND